jgi:nucleotide-binding universal stress UspA family protein
MFEKILVALDDSKSSRTVFERALRLAKTHNSALMLVHVLILVDDLYPGDAFIGIPETALRVYTQRWEQQQQVGIDKLQALAAEATAAGISTEVTQHLGDPGKSICKIANNWNANLIVMGRRGLHGLSELLLGSTSNYVLHHAACNVLILQGADRSFPQLETAQTAAATS